MTGAFITVEGIDGSGKTTHLDFMQNWLQQHKRQVVRTREPGGTELGEILREILLQKNNCQIGGSAELLLFFAARAQHLDEVIRPALAAGQWILCERFIDSTYAYQGGGRGLAATKISVLEQLIHSELQPNLTMLLDVELKVSRARVHHKILQRANGEGEGEKLRDNKK